MLKQGLLLLTLLFIYTGVFAQTGPGGVSGAKIWLRPDAGLVALAYKNVPAVNRTASSQWPSAPYQAPNSVMSSATGWIANPLAVGEWLQLDLGSKQLVDGIVTKGRGDAAQWVSGFKIGYSINSVIDTFLTNTAPYWTTSQAAATVFSGNTDNVNELLTTFPAQLNVRYIRIIAQTYVNWIGMRADAVTLTTPSDGNTVSVWMDQSGNGRNASAVGVNAYQANSVNFYPRINFNGTYMQYGSAIFNASNGFNAATLYGVGVPVSGQHLALIGERSNNGYDITMFMYSNNYTYLDAPYGYRTNTSNTLDNVGGAYSVPNLFMGISTASNLYLSIQGKQVSSASRGSGYQSAGSANRIGSAPYGVTTSGNAGISEVIAFNTILSGSDQQKVNSYLALKYGITIDQSSLTNYVNSSGSSVFTPDATYKYMIAGIGRDSVGGFNQRITQATTPLQDVVILSTDNNFTNPNTSGSGGHANISKNGYYLVAGSNGLSVTYNTFSSLNSSVNAIMNRIWKVQESTPNGDQGAVYIKTTNTQATYLVVRSGNTNFGTSGDTYYPLSGGATAVNLSNGDYFTFATRAVGPGGVINGLATWWKADSAVYTTLYKNVPAANRTASSQWDANHNAGLSVLGNTGTSWAVATSIAGQWLQLDMGSAQSVDGIATKGRANWAQWVTQFTVSYSNDGTNWTPVGVQFTGNTDQTTEVVNTFPSPVTARYFRIYPTAWYAHISMRADMVNLTTTTEGKQPALWGDVTGNGRNAGYGGGTITYIANGSEGTNYNPRVNFNGAWMNYGPSIYPNGKNYDAVDLFGAGQFVSGQRLIFLGEYANNGDRLNFMKWENDYAYFDAPYGYRVNTPSPVSSYSSVAFNKTSIQEGWKSGTSMKLFLQGLTVATGTTGGGNYYSTNSTNHLGATPGYASYGDNGISELIAFNTALSNTERQKVNSYLAIKYGITLDQTTLTSYLNSAGTVVFTPSAMFKNMIFGIARDDNSGLHQRISSALAPVQDIVTLNTDNNFGAANKAHAAIAKDGYYLVIGNNGGNTSFISYSNNSNSSVNLRMNRIWKVQEKTPNGDQGNIYMKVNNSRAKYLIISSDSIIDANDSVKDVVNGIVNWNPANGTFFTFAAFQPAPGGVLTGLASWWRADRGVVNAIYKNVPAANRTASTEWSGLPATASTLNNSSCWAAGTLNTSQWLQLDLGSVQSVDGISTTGRPGTGQWVTQYTVSYSNDGSTFIALGVTFTGNLDESTVLTNLFSSSVTARYFRIYPVSWNNHISMHADLITVNPTLKDGSSASLWLDQVSTRHASIGCGGVSTYTTSGNTSNFNPKLNFNSSAFYYQPPVYNSTNTYNSMDLFGISYPASGVNTAAFSEFGTNGDWSGIDLDAGNNACFAAPSGWAACISGFTSNGVVNGVANLQEGWRSGTAMQHNLQGKTRATYTTGSTTYYSNGTYGFLGGVRGYWCASAGTAESEAAAYTTALSDKDRQKVNSYMALKYGITLDQSGTSIKNLINGTFDNSLASWTSSGNVVWASGAVSGMTNTAGFNGSNSTPNGVIYQDITTVNGTSYSVSAAVGRNGVTGGTMALTLDIIDVSTSTVIATRTLTAPGSAGSNTVYSQSFTGNGNNFRIRFTDISNATNSVDIHLDNITLSPNATLFNYSDYVNSNGTKVWAYDSIYSSAVFGMFRDDKEDHQQQIAMAVTPEKDIVAVCTDNNLSGLNGTHGNILNDRYYLVMGSNGKKANYTAWTPNNKADITGIMARIWKVQETGTDQGKIWLRCSNGKARYLLVRSGNANFTTDTANNTYYALSNGLVSVNLSDGQYYTFATNVIGPGGVANSSVWYDADDLNIINDNNNTVSQWTDASFNGNNAIQNTVAYQPVYGDNTTDHVNFHAPLKFDGNKAMAAASILGNSNTYTNANTFVLSKTTALSSSSIFIESGLNTGSQFNLHAPWGDGNVYWDGAGTARISAAWGGTLGVPYLWTGFNNTGLSPLNQLRRDGTQIASGSNSISYKGNNTPFYVGTCPGSGNYYGNMNEVVVYTSALSSTQRQQVESYMAIKYGKTLGNISSTSYLASDGSTAVWNSSNTGYHKNVFGIARDDKGGLLQLASKSTESGDIIQLATSNNFSSHVIDPSRTDIAFNKYYLMVGNNAGSLNYTVASSTVNSNINTFMGRKWRVQETTTNGDQGTVYVKVYSKNAQYIVVSADSTFGNNDDVFTPVGSDSVAAVDLENGQYFTFAGFIKAPGGVFTGIGLWLKADAGVSYNSSGYVDMWSDRSNNPLITTQATSYTVDNAIAYADNMINFNPSVVFSGATGRSMFGNNTSSSNWSGTLTIYGISNTSSGSSGSGTAFSSQYKSLFCDVPIGTKYGWAADGAGTAHYGSQTGYSFGTSSLGNTVYKSDNLQNSIIYTNGLNYGTFSSSSYAATPSNYFEIGGRTSGGYTTRILKGKLPEVVVYNTDHSVTTAKERQRINTYLALKYGITLGNANSTDTMSYLNTIGNIVWPGDATYQNHIIGLAKDNTEDLHQRIATSQMPNGDIITLATDNADFTSANSLHAAINNDRYYLVVGNNAASLSTTTFSNSGKTDINSRLNRVWKAYETQPNGDQGPVYIKTSNKSLKYLVLSADASFDNSDTYIPLTANVAQVDFPAGVSYFTFATYEKAPGGVIGSSLWLRADQPVSSSTPTADGTLLDLWQDYGASSNDATQPISGSRPIFKNNSTDNVNFNPVISYSGSQYFNLDINKLPTGTGARSFFTSAKPTAVSSTQVIVGWGTAGSGQSSGSALSSTSNQLWGNGTNNTSNTGVWSAGVFNSTSAIWLGNGGNASHFNKYASANTPAALTWNTSLTGPNVFASVGRGAGANLFTGTTGDVIVYPFAVNNGQRLKIESYLALKYGYTIDQTSATNYLATDSTRIWDAVTNASANGMNYNRNIAGIGRDDAEDLNQKQSNSINSGAQLLVGLGSIAASNSANGGSFVNDKSYTIWGDDNGSLSESTSTDIPAYLVSTSKRIGREWRAAVTGDVQNNLEVQFNLTTTNPSNTTTSKFYLLVDEDGNGNFTSGTVRRYKATSYNTSTKVVVFDSVKLMNNEVFTIVTEGDIKQVYVKVKAMLQGAMSGTSMTSTLRTAGYLPLSQPYGGSPWNYLSQAEVVSSIPTGVTDWVLVEVRDSASPSTILGRRAAFVKTDGSIVDMDGTSPVLFEGVAPGRLHIVVKHRNHLPIRTATAQQLTNSSGTASLYDFTSAQSQAYQDVAITGNTAMKDMGNGKFVMWGGDGTKNGTVNYSVLGNDEVFIKNALSGNLSSSKSGYYDADFNMNGTVNYSVLGNDEVFLKNVLGGVLSKQIKAHQ